MVPVSSIIAIIIMFILTMAGPIAILLFYALRHKKQGIWSAWGLGAAGFFVMQMVIRVPILSVLSMFPWFIDFANNNYVIYAIILGFTAGLFELIGRYTVAKIMAKNLTYRRSVAAGLGHGGIEVISVVGMTYVNNLIYAFIINSGTFDSIIDQVAAMGMDTTQYIMLKDTLINFPAALYFLGGYERVLTVTLHLAMTLIVCYFVAKKQDIKGCLICLGIHTLIDAGTGLLQYIVPTSGDSAWVGYVIIYGFLTALAVSGVFIIKHIRKGFASLTQ